MESVCKCIEFTTTLDIGVHDLRLDAIRSGFIRCKGLEEVLNT